MAEVSRRAGVGMATLYRNFPGRRELLEALYTDEVDALCEAADDGRRRDAGREVRRPGCAGSSRTSTSKRHIASELLEHADRDDPVFDATAPGVLAAGGPLLVAAQQADEVRDDLTLEQILDMIIAIAKIHGDAGYLEPILQTALDGLRPT